MGLILSIETSTTVCSVAITNGSNTVATQKLFLEKSHSNLLTIIIQNTLDQCSIGAEELDAIAVSEGPGSYTGLRIGVSTAKGLCYTLEKPLISIRTLEAMAYEVNKFNSEEALLVPMLDARRMEVYTATYDSGMELLSKTNAKILDDSSFAETLKENRVLFFGDGSDKFKPLVESQKNIRFIPEITPSAWAVGQLASQKLLSKDFEDVAYFEPFYLKEFRATVPKALL